MAVRGALGAARGAASSAQLITESVVLAIVSGLVGLLLASGAHRRCSRWRRRAFRVSMKCGMHVPVFLFALVAASMCGVVFGLAPALRASRTPLVETLKEGGRGASGASQRRAQRLLVVAEIALALILSVGAGLMSAASRSFSASVPDSIRRISSPSSCRVAERVVQCEDAAVRRFYDAAAAAARSAAWRPGPSA